MAQSSGRSKKLSVIIEAQACRLDHALINALREQKITLSRNQLKAFFEAGQIWVGEHPRPASWQLSAGTHFVEILESEQSLEQSQARPSKKGSFLPVIYEDENLLVLHKLSGVPSVPLSNNDTETAVGSALAHFPGLALSGLKPLEPGLLHRLDTGTSGLLAFAKTAESFEFYRQAWRDGRVHKTYRALVSGKAQALTFPRTIRLELAHHIHSTKKMMVIDERAHKYRGKPLPTVTHLKKIHSTHGDTADLEIVIETGVMHQIRCTLAHLGLPILGDPIYSPAPSNSDRLQLHAWKLTLPCMTGQGASTAENITKKGKLTLVSQLPPSFNQN